MLRSSRYFLLCLVMLSSVSPSRAADQPLLAGVAKVDVTNTMVLPIRDRLYVKALVLKSGATTAALITVDAVSFGEIGPIPNDYLPKVRARLQKELNIAPTSTIFNASHCHGIVSSDIDEKTVQAVKQAAAKLVPVTVGVGVGHEDRIQENRRLTLKSGRTVDVRHAYSMPADDDVADVGPIDPQIGLLRLDTLDGKTLAVVYNFACHPIMGLPGGENTADLTGFASRVIEDNLSDGTIALFVQGCGGDINPVQYKDVDHPRNAEPLGNLLGLSALKGLRTLKCRANAPLAIIQETLAVPRADHTRRIEAMEAEQSKLVRSLTGTSLSLKTFLPLAVKYDLGREFPSYYSHRYLHEKKLGRADLAALDASNRRNLQAYIRNIQTMEELTRNQTNLALLRKHNARNHAAGMKPVEVELTALRVGDFRLITFPGELTVEIGLNIKKAAPHPNTFVAGYSNGYLYYTPTAKQIRNPGSAQEDCDCLLAPEWQNIFEERVGALLKKLR